MPKRIDHLQQHPLSLLVKTKPKPADQSFQSLLEQKITISKHAQLRLEERSITMPDETWMKMKEKMEDAKQKGINDALILSKEAAFIVSVKNSTVITAMNRKEAVSQIFTNINGTIILD
ncbi:TIGR02530 family flagellar biosynthesis protein [Metabacillus sp. 113a]|uniref:TIGR02530 family flagellar biosynthesis protein n=1 Tax=Metabacillus sp. 113a TaxID=3404706 RepID=UPI003CF3F319